jgi:translation initiation factor IF-3
LQLVFFKGRSIIYKDQGQILLLRLATDLEELVKWKRCQFLKEEDDYVHCSEERQRNQPKQRKF